jgi:hypothetical protein
MDGSTTAPRPGSRPHWRVHGGRLAVLGACAAVLYARKPDLFQRPQFWAEDGRIFFLQAYAEGAHSILIPYAGYLHLAPRLVAGLAHWFDPAWTPSIYVGASVLLTLWVASRALSPRFPFEPRLACALAVVLVPDAFEVLLILTNVQWVLAAGLVSLLVSDDPFTGRQKMHDVGAALLTGLTGPFSALLAPAFLWRTRVRRSLWSGIVAGIVTTCGIVQLVCMLRHPAGLPPDPKIEPIFGPIVIGSRVAGSLLLGRWVPSPPGVGLGLSLAVLTIATVVYLAARDGAARTQRLWAGFASIVLLAAAIHRSRFVLRSEANVGYGSRYFFPVQLVVLWLLVSLSKDGPRVRRAIGTCAIVVVLVTNVPRMRERPLEDRHWPEYVPRIRAGDAVVVPINPGWTIPLPGRH